MCVFGPSGLPGGAIQRGRPASPVTLKPMASSAALNSRLCSKQYPPRGLSTSLACTEARSSRDSRSASDNFPAENRSTCRPVPRALATLFHGGGVKTRRPGNGPAFCVACSTSMPLKSRPYGASRSERAVTALPHVFLDSGGFSESRHRLADDRVVREEVPRLFLEIGIPDRADAGVVPADDVIAIVRSTHVLREGGARDKGRGGDGDGCTESGNATHEKISPFGY